MRTTCHRKTVFVKVPTNDSILVGQDGGLDGRIEVYLCFSWTVQGKSPHIRKQEGRGWKYPPSSLTL